MTLAWWWIATATLPCEPPPPLPEVSWEASRAYAEVGKAQAENGAWGAARIAFEQALAWAPLNEDAARGLRGACQQLSIQSALDDALAKMDAGDCEAASFQLSRLPPSPSVHLLRGICEFQLGRDEDAVGFLTKARQDPMLAKEADNLLALAQLAQGDARAAEQRLSLGAGDSTSEQLLKLASREGRLLLRAELGSGMDTNPSLQPRSAGTSSPSAAAELTASALLRSGGKISPYIMVSGSSRALAGVSSADSSMGRAGAGLTLSHPLIRGDLDYARDGILLGGTPYLTAHQVHGRGMLLWSRTHMAANYVARWESYAQSDFRDFSGFAQSGGVSLGYSASEHVTVVAGYGLSRERARVEELSYTEHGPNALILLSRGDIRLQLSAALLRRSHDLLDPDFQVVREDLRLEAQARAEWDLSRRWTAWASVDGFSLESRVNDLSSTRWVGQVGMAFTLGLL